MLLLSPQSFKKGANSLWEISDAFIAQNATTTATWPDGGNDVLYPSATMKVDALVFIPGTGPVPVPVLVPNKLQFKLPLGVVDIPTYIDEKAKVSCLNKRKKIPRGTTVTAKSIVDADGTFTITFSGPVSAQKGDLVSFAKGKHEQLVRRWRWYLKSDLLAENSSAIRQAISSALDDDDFKKITFQAIEDTQKVHTRIETLLGNDLEFGDDYILHLVLMTQQTTAPDPLDPQ